MMKHEGFQRLRRHGSIAAAFLAFSVLGITLAGCGGGGGSSGGSSSTPTTTPTGSATTAPTPTPTPAPPVGVTVDPQILTLNIGETKTLAAKVTNTSDIAVLWQVQEGTRGGSISPEGVYTAPAQAGTYHVDAISHADRTKTTGAVVAVKGIVRLGASTVQVNSGASTTLQATTLGYASPRVSWFVQEPGGGMITSGGAYTAPAARGTYHVAAVSQSDTTVYATVTVTVLSGDTEGTVE